MVGVPLLLLANDVRELHEGDEVLWGELASHQDPVRGSGEVQPDTGVEDLQLLLGVLKATSSCPRAVSGRSVACFASLSTSP